MSPYVVFLLYMLAILGFVGFTLLLNRSWARNQPPVR